MMMGADDSRWAPTTHETADHSLPYCVSIALLDGKVTGESFADARLRDPVVGSLMRKVKVREEKRLSDAYPGGRAGPRYHPDGVGRDAHARSALPEGAREESDERGGRRARSSTTWRGGACRTRSGRRVLAAIANLEQSGNVGRDLVRLVTQ